MMKNIGEGLLICAATFVGLFAGFMLAGFVSIEYLIPYLTAIQLF